MQRIIVVAVLGIAAAACGSTLLQAEFEVTPISSSTPTPTSTSTLTPTHTPTPTATAAPAIIRGDPRASLANSPIRQSGAPCGYVDYFDFPLDPPDGNRASGGGDFARYRGRFDGFHAGEDWRVGRSSFGQPVYAIGHGQVTYAQPNGWGADKGVVIVQHTFRDRSRVFSFYGHLDPPSVEIRAGQCVERNDMVGRIGDPRSPPHLHFEIRVHLGETPGPGYWPTDPSLAGWRAPSATVWMERMFAMPGARWSALGDYDLLGEGLVFHRASNEIRLVNLESGKAVQRIRAPESFADAAVDVDGSQLYIAQSTGTLEGWDLSSNGVSAEVIWSTEMPVQGNIKLLPLSEGGVLGISRTGAFAASQAGELLWHEPDLNGLRDSVHTDTLLIVLSDDRPWAVDSDGARAWTGDLEGIQIMASETPLVYSADGLVRLDLSDLSHEQIYGLPPGNDRLATLTELPDGLSLLLHSDRFDQRLIALESDGSVRWERSIAELRIRAAELVTLNGDLFLVASYPLGNAAAIDIMLIDSRNGNLNRVFAGGTRTAAGDPFELAVHDDQLLLDIDGVGLLDWGPDDE